MSMLPSIFSLTPPILGFGAQRAATGQHGLQNVTDRIGQALQFFTQLNEQTQARRRQQELERQKSEEQEKARKKAEKRQNRAQNIAIGTAVGGAVIGGGLAAAAAAPAASGVAATEAGLEAGVAGAEAGVEAGVAGAEAGVEAGVAGSEAGVEAGVAGSEATGAALPEVFGPPVNIGAPPGLSTGSNLDIVNAPGQGLFVGPTQANAPLSVTQPAGLSSTPVTANRPAIAKIALGAGLGAAPGVVGESVAPKSVAPKQKTQSQPSFASQLGLRESDLLPFGQKSPAARFGLGFLASLSDNLTGSNLLAAGLGQPQRNIQNALAIKNLGLNASDIALRRDRVGLERINIDRRERELQNRQLRDRNTTIHNLVKDGVISKQKGREMLGFPGAAPLPPVKATLGPGGSTVSTTSSGPPSQEVINQLQEAQGRLDSRGTLKDRTNTAGVGEFLTQLDQMADPDAAIGFAAFIIKDNGKKPEVVARVIGALRGKGFSGAEISKQLKQRDSEAAQIVRAFFPNGIK